MSESKVRDNNFFLVSGWMLNRLNLKGAALQIYAIIYGFSQDGEGSFTGSLQYLCDFTNSSKNTVLKALKELTEKGYVTKAENTINGVRFCTYRTAPLVQELNQGGAEIALGGGSKTAPGGGAETEPNNKDINNKSIISKDIEEVIDLYHSICVSLPTIRAVSSQRAKAIKARLQTYSLNDFKAMFEKAEASSFLKGKNERGWSATFDWLINEANMAKVLEDNYADRGRKEKLPDWFGKRELDDDEMAAIRQMMADDEETDQLRRELQEAFGGK